MPSLGEALGELEKAEIKKLQTFVQDSLKNNHVTDARIEPILQIIGEEELTPRVFAAFTEEDFQRVFGPLNLPYGKFFVLKEAVREMKLVVEADGEAAAAAAAPVHHVSAPAADDHDEVKTGGTLITASSSEASDTPPSLSSSISCSLRMRTPHVSEDGHNAITERRRNFSSLRPRNDEEGDDDDDDDVVFLEHPSISGIICHLKPDTASDDSTIGFFDTAVQTVDDKYMICCACPFEKNKTTGVLEQKKVVKGGMERHLESVTIYSGDCPANQHFKHVVSLRLRSKTMLKDQAYGGDQFPKGSFNSRLVQKQQSSIIDKLTVADTITRMANVADLKKQAEGNNSIYFVRFLMYFMPDLWDRKGQGPLMEEKRFSDEVWNVKGFKFLLNDETLKKRGGGEGKGGARKKSRPGNGSDDDDGEGGRAPPPFDTRRLRKKYDYMDGENALTWNEADEEANETKIVSYSEGRMLSELPLTAARTKKESKVVVRAAQAFHIDANGNFPGCISGQLQLPPTGIKDAEGVGLCSQVFNVANCQPKALEFAIGDPKESDGLFRPETAQRFLLSPGDMFYVPAGNVYRIENHSKTHDCRLVWTIVRPFKNGSS